METQSSNSNANASHNDDAKDQEKDSEDNSSELEQRPQNISEGHNNKDAAMASTDAQEGGNESLLPPQKRLRTASITSAPDKTSNITALNNQTPHNHAEAASRSARSTQTLLGTRCTSPAQMRARVGALAS